MTIRTRLVTLIGVLALVGALVPASAGASTGSSTRLLSAGDAWGSFLQSGTVVSGPTALSTLGCGATNDGNSVDSVATPPLSAGLVTTDVRALQSGPGTRSTTVVHNLNILGGRITADAVKAVSTTSRVRSGFASSGAGSTLLNLRIDGRAIGATPRPNQRIALPGAGYVLLNHEVSQDRGAIHTTQLLEVHLSNGTTVIVSHARSALNQVGGILGGVAFGSAGLASSGSALATQAGPSARVNVPCGGTNGQVLRNRVATVRAPSLFTLQNVVSTAEGKVSARAASDQLTDRIEGADLLGGLVKATAIRAVASGSALDGQRRFSAAGSSFGGLAVRGFAGLKARVAPNTRVHVSGLGTLWLHRVIKRSRSIEVRMIELDVTEPNHRGLPVGATVKVGVARAYIG